MLAPGPALDLLVVDGFATPDPAGRPGLGAHAAEAFGIPVIGVAKTPFRTATHAAEVHRGVATRPLYVTSAGGIALSDAARIVAGMTGPHRIPTALARVDALARGPGVTGIRIRTECAEVAREHPRPRARITHSA